MRPLMMILCAFLIMACQPKEEKVGASTHLPLTLELFNENGQEVGMATHVKDDLFLTADHLLAKSKGLYYQNSKIKVIARDFSHDLLLFRAYGLAFLKNKNIFKEDALQAFEKYYWQHGESRKILHFLHKEKTMKLERELKEDVIVFSGFLSPGKSGTPFFDKKGHVYGILIGGEERTHAFGVGMENISVFLSENIDE